MYLRSILRGFWFLLVLCVTASASGFAQTTPEITFSGPLYPPYTSYFATPSGAAPVQYNGTPLLIKKLEFTGSSSSSPLPGPGGTNVYPTTTDCRITFSTDFGSSWLTISANAGLFITQQFAGSGSADSYNSELLQMEVYGGNLPPQLHFRESPTLQSLGQTTVRADGSSGAYALSSFFDVFTEISIDGGANWIPTTLPLRVQLDSPPIGTEFNFASENIPVAASLNSPKDYPSGHASGFRMQNLSFHDWSTSAAPPALGGSGAVSATCDLDLEYSMNGAAFVAIHATATAQLLTTHAFDNGSVRWMTVECSDLEISSGDLPPNLRIRESPTKASLGRTSIRAASSGSGYSISSFFDIFTEISIDGGSTWVESLSSTHLDLAAPPVQSLELTFGSSSVTPPGDVKSPRDHASGQASGKRIRNIELGPLSPNDAAPDLGSSATTNLSGSGTMEFDNGSGAFTTVAVTYTATVSSSAILDAGDTRFFDTEMLSLELSASSVRLRESPSLPSKGHTTVRTVPGGYAISSFFDIFTELSVDDGSTWSPNDDAIRLQLDVPTMTTATATYATDRTPGWLHTMNAGETDYPFNGVTLRHPDLYGFDNTSAPPDLGSGSSFQSSGELEFDMYYGGAVAHRSVTVTATFGVHHNFDDGATRYFETEMLALDMGGGGSGGALRLRESPTKASLGRTSIRAAAGGDGYRISSFFDIFTELSMDGGATWTECAIPMHLESQLPDVGGVGAIRYDTDPYSEDMMRIPSGSSITFSDGSSIPKLACRDISPPATAGALGTETVVTRDFDLTLDLGVSGAAAVPAHVTTTATWVERAVGLGDDGKGYMDRELTSLSFTLPGGVMVRESPSKASLGRLSVTDLGGGLYRLNSFFDIFTELSVDGGSTWSPSTGGPAHLALDLSAETFTEGTFHDGSLLQGHFRRSIGGPATGVATGTVQVRAMDLSHLSPSLEGPVDGADVTTSVSGACAVELNLDGTGFRTFVCTATADIAVRSTGGGGGGGGATRFFDTEMLSMSLAGGGLPSGVMIRESPTLASKGQTKLTDLGDGTYRIGSFFDIFTELSVDGGTTWSPLLDSLRLEHADLAIPTTYFSTDSMPPSGMRVVTPYTDVVDFPNGGSTSGWNIQFGTPDSPVPDLGASVVSHTTRTCEIYIAAPGEQRSARSVTVTATISTTAEMVGSTGMRYFDTEMLSLELSCPDLPSLKIRESPSLPSRGQTWIANDHGTYLINSFFDIFTELSLDGGSTWSPATRSMRLAQGVPDVGSICITKYLDKNHNGMYEVGEPAQQGVTFTLTSPGSSTQTGVTDASGNVCFNGLPPAFYQLAETVPAGYVPTNPSSGQMNVFLAPGQNSSITWLDGAASDTTSFRTASMSDWIDAVDGAGKPKAAKCKPIACDFSFDLPVTSFSALKLELSMDCTGAIIRPAFVPETLATFSGKKPALITLATAIFNETLKVSGHGLKGAAMKIKYAWGEKGKKVTATVQSILRLPMPNLRNVGSDLDGLNAFPLVIGATSGAGSVSHKAFKDALKSLVVKGKTHTGAPRCLDSLDSRKPIKKQLTSLPPDKQNNKLFGETITLGLNLMASSSSRFPQGLGDLLWAGGFYCDGWSVDSIYSFANKWLACDDNAHSLDDGGDTLWQVLTAIDTAFNGPIDTLKWECNSLQMAGTRQLEEVSYLRADPGKAGSKSAFRQVSFSAPIPVEFSLKQNYPNPFNPATNIQFDLPVSGSVTLKVYNMLGQEVASLLDHQLMDEGTQDIRFNASQLASGVYFYRITVNAVNGDEDAAIGSMIYSGIRKMLLVK